MDAPVQLVFGPLDLTVSSPFSGVQPSLDGPFDRRAKRCPCSNSHATKSSVRWLCSYFSHCQDQLHNLWSLCSKVIKNFECNDGALNQAHSFLPRAWSLGPHHPNQSSDSFSAQSSLSHVFIQESILPLHHTAPLWLHNFGPSKRRYRYIFGGKFKNSSKL